MKKLVCGVGVYSKGRFRAYINKKITKEYSVWQSMLVRCYSVKCQIRQPTYVECTVSENFKNFQYFAEWCQNQAGFGLEGYQLDKDLLLNGNKQYHEDICVFIPSSINSFVISCRNRRGILPVGVSRHKDKFHAQISINNENLSLGLFEDVESAFVTYKAKKEWLSKQLAVKWAGLLDERVIMALENYTVLVREMESGV